MVSGVWWCVNVILHTLPGEHSESTSARIAHEVLFFNV